jgi:hypothetical protein
MPAFLRAATAAFARQHTITFALVITCGITITGARGSPALPTEDYSLGPSAALRCRPALAVGFLSADQKMRLATGNWGRGVHPQDPNFFRFEGEKRGDEEAEPVARREGTVGPAQCRRHSASDDRQTG